MKIAICQTESGTDKAKNLADIARLTEHAAREGASLALFPELSMYFIAEPGPEILEQAETLHGPFVKTLEALSADTGVAIVAGMTETTDDGIRAFNSSVVVTPNRGLTAVYHKQHLYDAFGTRESDFIREGGLDGPVTFEIDGFTVGVLTCYDLRFPEAARQHADAGVDLLLYPSAWSPGPHKLEHWNTLARARAVENTFYVAAVSVVPGLGMGNSLLIDPMGVEVARLGDIEGIAVGELSMQRITEVRAVNPSLANRRFAVISA